MSECEVQLPEMDVVHIGISSAYAQTFLDMPQIIGLSLLYTTWYSKDGMTLLKEVKDRNMSVYTWTANTPDIMRYD